MKTWLIIVMIVALMANALILGFFISKPVRHAIPRMPFPPVPPMVNHDIIPGLRHYFFNSRDSLHKHLRQLRMSLAEELTANDTDRSVIDSLVTAISDEQRNLQESIIAYVDSLKKIIPEEDRDQLRQWIMENFGERSHKPYRHRRSRRALEPAPSIAQETICNPTSIK